MPFNSYEFILIHLPVAFAGFWLLARMAGSAAALYWIILASIAFYAYASTAGLAIICPAILINYLVATALIRTESSRERLGNFIFVGGIIANVLFLGYFKYWNFFLDTAGTLWSTHFESAQIILPLGISFLTFQQIGFLIELRSGQISSLNLRDYLLFTLFFPRTLAGPIIRYNEVIPQLSTVTPRNLSADVAVGVCLFSIGLFKKTVIADGVAPYVPAGFDGAEPIALLTAWVSVLSYTFQLYFDFSGYSDMALGTARLFGVRLPMNFNSPLKASSIIDFWARWHISLTRFLTDFIYTPVAFKLTRARMSAGKAVLCGKHSSVPAIIALIGFPTLLTMTISGFWHGVGWQFVIWGVLHGLYLTINQGWRLFRPRFWPDRARYERIMRPVGFVLTFTAVVISMVFFRATSLTSAFSILSSMIGMHGVVAEPYLRLGYDLGAYLSMLIVPMCWIGVLFVITVFMPNSLEIMQRFEPALDFPRKAIQAPAQAAQSPTPQASADTSSTAIPRKSYDGLMWWSVLMGREGVNLSRATAALVALAFVLAIVAVDGSSAFLYFRF